MRVDNRRRVKEITNIINFDLASINNKFDNSEEKYGHNSWTIESKDSSINAIKLHRIFSEKQFNYYIKDLKDIRYYFQNELVNQAFRTIDELHFNLKYFYQYCEKAGKFLRLKDIGYNEILEYANYIKINNIKKPDRRISALKKVLLGLANYLIVVHEDIKNNNFPSIKFIDNAKKKEEFYTKEEYIKLSKLMTEIIVDYFDNKAPEHLFVKASFWLITFCTGFNMTGIKSLKKESFTITFENLTTITYLVVGEKNRNNDGYQKAIIKLKKEDENAQLFIKTLNRLFELSKEVAKIAKSIDKGFLFLSYSYNWDNQKVIKERYFRYTGEWFNMNKSAKAYFEKYQLQNIFLSTRKIRNQYSLEFFNLSKSEEFVAKVMNHSSVNTTIEHYMKFKLSNEMLVKFQLFQELLVKFSHCEEIDWSIYQKKLNLENEPIEKIIKNLSAGVFDTPMGQCLNKQDEKGNVCDSYISCFGCKNYSLISDKDLWKIFSFKESIEENKKDSPYYKLHYEPIIESINDFIANISKDNLLELKNKYQKHGKHPFWKNVIIIKQITEEYEANL